MMDQKKMRKMMKQMGIGMEELDDVEEIIIKRSDKELRFHDASVFTMKARGMTTYQIIGEPEEHPKTGDIQLIMDQTGVTEKSAREALEEANGDLAEAILKLKSS